MLSERQPENKRSRKSGVALSVAGVVLASAVAGASFGNTFRPESANADVYSSPTPTMLENATPKPSEAAGSPNPSAEPSPLKTESSFPQFDFSNMTKEQELAGILHIFQTEKIDPNSPEGEFLINLYVNCVCGCNIDQIQQPSSSPEPTVSPEPTLMPEATKSPSKTSEPMPKPTTKPTAKPTPAPTPKPTAAPVITYKSMTNGEVYNVPAGQEVLIGADAIIDGLDYHDDSGKTAAEDVIIDGKAHVVKFPYGGRIGVFTKDATLDQIKIEYRNAIAGILQSGRQLDPTSLNELVPPPQKDYWVSPDFAAGGEYKVPAGQRVEVDADATIDGVKRFDSNDKTFALDVIIDGQTHTISFPYGGRLRVFTDAATTQYIKNIYNRDLLAKESSGNTLDSNSFNELPQ